MDAERAKQIANATECSGDPNVRWITAMHAAKVLACKCDELESRIEQMQHDHAVEIEKLEKYYLHEREIQDRIAAEISKRRYSRSTGE